MNEEREAHEHQDPIRYTSVRTHRFPIETARISYSGYRIIETK